MAKQYVYTARDKELGTWKDADLKALIGGKGSGLFVMTSIGIPVPTFFSVSTEACTEYHKAGREITPEIQEQIWEALDYIESYDPRTGKTVGHISTMGNMMEWTKEDKERAKKSAQASALFYAFSFTAGNRPPMPRQPRV